MYPANILDNDSGEITVEEDLYTRNWIITGYIQE